MSQIKYPRWKQPKYPYKIINDIQVEVKCENVGKITGTNIGAFLGISAWGTPFTQSQQILGINDKDISDVPQVKQGIFLEQRIISYLAENHRNVGVMTPAKSLFEPRAGDHDSWKSDFEDEDFAGHVDGIVSKDNKDYILEIKTVKDIEKWDGNIPLNYLWQVYLYNHFITKQDRAYFGIGIVTDEDYKNPNNWKPNNFNCMLVPIKIDREMVANTIEKLRDIRKDIVHTCCAVNFDPDNPLDVELMNHLRDYLQDEDALLTLAQRLENLSNEITDRRQQINKQEMEIERIKARLKEIMITRQISQLGNVRIQTNKRVNVDIQRQKQQGIDLEPYIDIVETPVIKIQKKK